MVCSPLQDEGEEDEYGPTSPRYKKGQEFPIFRSLSRGFGRNSLRGSLCMEEGCKFPEGSFVIASSRHKEFHYDEM